MSVLKSAYQDAAKHNWTKEELEAYDYVLMREQDEKGRWTLLAKKEIAKKLIDKGLADIEITEITGLSSEQIRRLKR